MQDVNRIIRFYNNRGFFGTEVKPETKGDADNLEIIFKIFEGRRPKISKIRFSNGEKKLEKFLAIEKDDFFLLEKIKKSTDDIGAYYKDIGYAFANIKARSIPDSGILVFEIQKGKIYYIKDIVVSGLKFCNPSVVRHEIIIEPGDVYSRKKVLNSQLRIYRLGFFSTVDVDMTIVSDDSLILNFNLRELKSRIFNWGVGVSIPLSFIISLGLEEMNLFNVGHRFRVQPSFKINIKKEWETRIDIIYSIPYFTELRLSPSLLPFYWYEDKENFTRKIWGTEFRISKIFSEHIQANIANKYKYIDVDIEAELPDTFSATTNSIKFQLMGDYRNEFFNPRSGIYFVPLIEYAGGLLGGSNHYLRFEFESRYYRSFLLSRKNIIAQRIKLGFLFPTDGVNLSEKYYLGGQYSLRGYPERSIGPDSLEEEHYGEFLFNFNIENRLTLYKNLGLVFFFDMGYLDNLEDLFRDEYFKMSWGAGLRYYTPIGPIRADAGFPVKDKGMEFYLGLYHIF